MEECHTVGVVARTVEQQVFWGVRLCGAPGAVRGVGHPKSMEVGVEAGVANPQPGDGSVQGPTGGVGPPMVS